MVPTSVCTESKPDDCFVIWNIFLPFVMPPNKKLNMAEKLLKLNMGKRY